jgi:hypothetical protein
MQYQLSGLPFAAIMLSAGMQITIFELRQNFVHELLEHGHGKGHYRNFATAFCRGFELTGSSEGPNLYVSRFQLCTVRYAHCLVAKFVCYRTRSLLSSIQSKDP